MSNSIGLIESKGLVAVIEAADVILKNSPVTILGVHKLQNGLVTLAVSGDSDYVKAAIESGIEAGRRVGEIYASSIVDIPEKELIKIFSELFPNDIDFESASEGTAKVKIIPEASTSKFVDNRLASVDNKIKSDSKREKSKPLQVTKITPVHKSKINKEQSDNKLSDKLDEFLVRKIDEEKAAIDLKAIPSESTKPLSTIERLRIEALGLESKKNKSKEINLTKPKKAAKENNLNTLNENKEIDFEAISKMNVHKLRHYAREFQNFPIKGREISRANRDELVNIFKTIVNE